MPRPLVQLERVTFERWIDTFNGMRDRLLDLDRAEVFVGSAVFYGVFQEYGTRYLSPRPFLQIGFSRAAVTIGQGRDVLGGANIYNDRERLWAYLTGGLSGQPRDSRGRFAQKLSGEQLMGELGEVVRLEAQRAAAELGVYDTGNLLESIAWGNTEDEMLSKSRAAAPDKTTLL